MAQPPRSVNYSLTDKAIQAAKPKPKPYPIADGGGLFIEVLTSGSKVWRYSYGFNGKRTKVTIGAYPAIGIKAARNMHEAMRGTLATGIDPARQKQLDKIEAEAKQAQALTFETFARLWLNEVHTQETTARTQKQNMGWLMNDVFPAIGAIPFGSVHAADVLKLLEGLRNTPTKANNIRSVIDRIYCYGAQKLLVTYNPAEAMKGLIKKPASKSYQPIKAHEIGDFIAAVNASGAHMGTKLAVHFLLLTAVRKDNVCKARWEHIDMEAKTWTIPARTTGGNGFMKMQHPHTVYLSRQALDILKQARWLSGNSEWVFPSVQKSSKPMTEVAMNHLFSRLKSSGLIADDIAPHGLRSTASTIMNEHGISPDVVEIILAHNEKSSVRARYNHATHAAAAAKALQWYADYLDQLAAGNVVDMTGQKLA